jgi:hypothetical protein
MGAKDLTRAAILATIAVAWLDGIAPALELGEVQAVPSGHPPYIFRLPMVRNRRDGGDMLSVTVRRPTDVLGLVKNSTLELRLQNLTDVELEISYGGQTLNRLVLKDELQTAHARLVATLAWNRYRAAKAKGQTRAQLAALLNEAYQTHRAWAQLDPSRAQQPFSQVEREQRLFLAADLSSPPPIALAEATPPPPASQDAADPLALEQEMRLIREEIRGLVGQVIPWVRESARPWQDAGQALTPTVAALLGGLLAAGIALLGTGYLIQRRALKRERQRRRVLAAAIRRGHQALPAASLALSLAPPAHAPGPRSGASEPVVTVRRIRVAHRTRRRMRTGGMKAPTDAGREPPEQTRRVVRMAHPGSAAPAGLLAALSNLRQELIRIQGLLPSSTNANIPPSGSRRAAS